MNNKTGINEHLIKLIESTFSKVNKKIRELLECSVKDFVYLNSSFKKYHNQLDRISNTTDGFFDFIESLRGTEDLVSLCNDAKNQAEKLSETNKVQFQELKHLNNKYNFILLNLNNLKQDLGTLRLLFTNLRFDPTYDTDQQRINKYISNITDIYNECTNSVSITIDKLNKLIDFSEEGYRNGLDLYIDIIERTTKQAGLINNLEEKAKRYKIQLKDIEEKKSTSTSEIITNLQFQDILRQKIEHIQKAHNQITKNLYSSHKKGQSLNPAELYQIRDISSLQSAQLIHANQEYQTAVEIILERISVLKQVVNSYNNICLHFCIPENTRIHNIFNSIREELVLLSTQTFSLNQISDKYCRLIMDIPNFKLEIDKYYSSIQEMFIGINELEEIISKHKEYITIDEQFSPLSQLKTELPKFKIGYEKLLLLFKELEHDQFLQSLSTIENNFSNFLIRDFANKVTEIIQELSERIDNNLSPIKVSGANIEFSFENVSYYQTFEKEVIEIIHILDILLENINFNKSDIDKAGLESLKEMYTMKSERDIHDSIVGNKKMQKQNNNNDNEVEFF